MRLLILTQYYLPETGAPQNRLSGLARELSKKGIDVEVLTSMPNYPQMKVYPGYEKKKFMQETILGIPVNRSWIHASLKRNVVARLLNYFSFVCSSIYYSSRIKGDFDYVLCESPPLFLGLSAVYIAKKKRARLIFNVSDLWPESAVKLNIVTNSFLINLAYKLEKSLYKKSFLVTGQTKGICENISSRFPETKVHWLPNGIDEERFDQSIQSNWRIDNGFGKEDFILLYAGIIGHAQGLEILLEAARLLKQEEKIKFILVGDGPEKVKLMSLAKGMANIFFFDSIPSTQMPGLIAACDIAVIPLRRLDIFKGAIPSKIFENLAMEKPVLLGVEGEAKEIFIDTAAAGLAFTPEDASDLADKITYMHHNPEACAEMGKRGREFVLKEFGRGSITNKFMSRLSELERQTQTQTERGEK